MRKEATLVFKIMVNVCSMLIWMPSNSILYFSLCTYKTFRKPEFLPTAGILFWSSIYLHKFVFISKIW